MTVRQIRNKPTFAWELLLTCGNTGGKAKPLKAPKKGPKDLDEDDLAYLEKKRAGMFLYDLQYRPSHLDDVR